MKNIMNERLPISKSSPLRIRFFDYQHFTYPWHFHSEYEILYIQAGTGTRFVGDNVDKYTNGDVFLLGSNLPHYMKSDEAYHAEDSKLRVKGVNIQFEKDFMYHAIHHYPHFINIKKLLEDAQKGVYFPAGCSVKIVELLNRIPLEKGIDQMTSFLQLLKEMTEIKSKQPISTSDVIDEKLCNASRIDNVISYLNKHYHRKMDLSEIASHASMNPAAFCRFFKSKTGKTFKNYVLDMRISYARKLLLMDDMNISQISVKCGFDTISYFNKTFKKHSGYSPTEYRKMMLTTSRF